MSLGAMTTVTAAELSRNFGLWQDRALNGPVAITHHGRRKVVLISADEFSALSTEAQDEGAGAPGQESSQVSFAVVLENMNDGFLALDADMILRIVNRVAETYLSSSRDLLIGRPITAVLPQLAGSIFMDHIARVLRTGEIAEFEAGAIIAPGRSIAVRVFPHPEGVGLIFSNRTEYNALREQVGVLQAFRLMLNGQGMIGVATLNPRGVLVEINAGLAEITGFPVSELIQRRIVDVFHPRERAKITAAVESVFDLGRSMTLETAILVQGHVDTPVVLSLAPIMSDIVPSGVAVMVAPASIAHAA